MKQADIPVFVAVTGHRDLKNPNDTARHLRAFFSQLKKAMSHTTFYLMSGFAAGADQLFVACGKEVLGKQAQVFAVLPFKRAEYQKDFSGRDLDLFNSQLAIAECVLELPGSRTDEAESYFAVGRYMAENANMMVAIWDGNVPYDKDNKSHQEKDKENAKLYLKKSYDLRKQIFGDTHSKTKEVRLLLNELN